MRTGSTLVRVVPNVAGGFDVKEPRAARPLLHAESQELALVRAREALYDGGVVQIVNGDGFIIETHHVPFPGRAGRPWWYVPFRDLAVLLGVLQFIPGLLRLVEGESGFSTWLGAFQIIFGLLLIWAAVVSRRRGLAKRTTAPPPSLRAG